MTTTLQESKSLKSFLLDMFVSKRRQLWSLLGSQFIQQVSE
jgi:hypothetical protein